LHAVIILNISENAYTFTIVTEKNAFFDQLGAYKQAIDADIAAYAAHVRRSTAQQYGPHAAAVTDAYLTMLEQGGKRIRGALVMTGYEMCGGTDKTMIVRAATALEMIHAYILIIDDIQDRSKMRRGKPTVHEVLAAYHEKNAVRGDAVHTGVSLALNAALTGAHAAQMLLAGLSVDPDLKTKVLGIVNHTMITTAHGQTTDIMNELIVQPDPAEIARALEWKTAHYTMLNPLCVGMALAGAECDSTDAIREYALQAGRAFQITDDIIGIFGDDEQTGKTSMDDMREGKQTILTAYALEHAAPADRQILRTALGNPKLTRQEFERAREVISASGALANATTQAERAVQAALASLDLEAHRWSPKNVQFLRNLAAGLLARTH
jgi:geranylgeranyl diphosphate synthase type I